MHISISKKVPTTNSIGFVFAVNKDSWNALPDDLKLILDTAAPSAAVQIAALYSGVVENSKKEAEQKYGVKFHTLSTEDQLKATALAIPIWDQVAKKSPDCAEGVEAIKETLRFLGRMPE